MAAAARTLTRLTARTAPPIKSNLRLTATHDARLSLQRQTFQPSFRRSYASTDKPTRFNRWYALGGLTIGAAAISYYFWPDLETRYEETKEKKGSSGETKAVSTPKKEDYQQVYNEIAKLLEEKDDYDDGSYGPVIVRLAWHCSGTYDKETNTGGSNGATMRFAPEGDHGANSGLKAARDFLEPVKEKHPWISYSDLWTLAGVCAIQEMQGPAIPWRPGRNDRDVSMCTPDGRLPDGAKDQSHLRAIFNRMGFDDREIVALSGAHALGRCHTDRSGFDGPWSFSPTVVSNDYFRLLLSENWGWRKWNGPRQYQDAKSKSLMMLPTDMALVKDPSFKKHVERYAKDDGAFFKEFSDVIVKLFELGVPFQSKEEDRMTLKTLSA